MRIRFAFFAGLTMVAAFLPIACKKNRAPGEPTVTGSLSGSYGDSLEFAVVSADPDGDDVSYYAEWGDGTVTDWTASSASGTKVTLVHVYADSGRYGYRAKARDGSGLESDWSDWDTIPIGYATPPAPGVPAGPAQAEEWQPCSLSTAATGPAGESLSVQFDWGDATSDWVGPQASGDTFRSVRAYDSSGVYSVRARAMLGTGAVSEWSGALQITVTTGRPRVPDPPTGPAAVYAGARDTFRVTAVAPRNQPVLLLLDWGDGEFDTSVSTGSGETAAWSHVWSTSGSVSVRVRAMLAGNTGMISGWSAPAQVSILPNAVPSRPQLTVPGFAIPGASALFQATAADADNDSVSVMFDFGDGIGSWTALVPSGGTARDSHTYLVPETVYVKCRARDARGAESGWTDSTMLVVEQSGLVRWYWWNSASQRQPPLTSPVVLSGAGTVIYTGCADGKFYGVNSSGATAYTGTQVSFGELFTGHPAYCAETGHLIVGNTDGELYAFSEALSRAWHWPGYTRPESLSYKEWGTAAVSGNRIYAGRSNDSIYCLRDLGSSASLVAVWGLGAGVVDAPVVEPGGDVMFGTEDGRLFRMDANLTSVYWNPQLEPAGRVHSPAIASDGTVIVGTDAGRLFALRPDGSTRWTANLSGQVGKPVVGTGLVFVGTSVGSLYAVDLADGSIEWQKPLSASTILSSPMLTSGGYLYCQDSSDVLYCVRQVSGAAVWTCDCPSFLPPAYRSGLGIGRYAGSPALDQEGNVVVVGQRALYFVSGLRGELLAPVSWPKWQHDASNTGKAGSRR